MASTDKKAMAIKTCKKEGRVSRKRRNKLYNGAVLLLTRKGCLKKAWNQRIKTISGMINKVAGCCDLKKRIIGVKSRKINFHRFNRISIFVPSKK